MPNKLCGRKLNHERDLFLSIQLIGFVLAQKSHPTSTKDPKRSSVCKMSLYRLSCTVSFFLVSVNALDNGLALTPPMGWLSWERFGCQTNCEDNPDTCISERLYLNQAKLLLHHGYRNVGYEYVNIDDCWSEMERDQYTGKIVEDRNRFPSGIKNLSQTLHSMGGFKLGLYGDIGTKTCVGYPGFEGHFELDAHTLAFDFEIDSIKVDACNANETNFNTTYPEFGRALNKTGRPILYSCSWPNDYYERHNHWENPDYLNHGIKQTCNQWRNYRDVFDNWESISNIIDFWARTTPDDVLVRAAGSGGWNDPDMLVVGNPGLSLSEQQAQFAFWAIFAAPLMISADLRTIPKESRSILLNEDIIAINQDLLGRQGWCAEKGAPNNGRVWVRELYPSFTNRSHNMNDIPQGTSDTWAVLLENRNTIFGKHTYTFDPARHLPCGIRWKTFSVRDVIKRQDLGQANLTFSYNVDESSIAMFKVVLVSTTDETDSSVAR